MVVFVFPFFTHAVTFAELPLKKQLEIVDHLENPIKKVTFSDFPLAMQKIFLCESGGRHDYRGNVIISKTEDIGIAQINKPIHNKTATSLGLNLYNVSDNLSYAYWLWQREGTAPWTCSKILGLFYRKPSYLLKIYDLQIL